MAFVAAYLLAWWVISSAASRRHGGIVFAFGLVLLWAGMRAYRRGRPAWLLRLSYLSLLAAAAAVLLEAALHVRPGLLSGRVANFAYTGYHPYRGGIYSIDPHVGQLMRPAVRRWMYWNGHWWRHESNGRGWRGPELDRADAVFLGDSMIYGHGVNEEGTVSAQFARRTGATAANLGQQGTCAVQQLILLRRRGRPLRPRVVFLCAHPTDVEDVTRMYETSEQRRFLADPTYEPRVRPGPPARWDPLWLWGRHVGLPLRSGGILGTLLRTVREGRTRDQAAIRDPFLPREDEFSELAAAFSAQDGSAFLAVRVHEEALREVGRECARLGARLVLFDIGYPRAFAAATEALAGEIGAEYSPAGAAALRRARAGSVVYLANDGHWTAEGAAIVAQALARTAAARDIMRD
jgi:hypothetical protein